MALQYCVTKKGSKRKVAVKCNISYCYIAIGNGTLHNSIHHGKMESAFAMSSQWQLIHPR